MYEDTHFTHDAAAVRFDGDADGITVDEDSGEASFDWSEVETVTIDNPPHANAFDSKEFYKLPATVAKPIPQPYRFGEDDVTWLKKPREELKAAAWSLDNAPWTLGHPETGMVKDVNDVHGFWRDPRYLDSLDDLDADLHVPTGDEDAKEFIEDNGDVSVGFYNRIARTDEYDGVVGGSDDDGVDVEGYQTDMIFDHVASVEVGRCPSGAGCGLDTQQHGHVAPLQDDGFIRGTIITDGNEEGAGSAPPDSTMSGALLDQSEHTNEGSWYAVPPSDNPDDEWKFPVDNCSDVDDAWHFAVRGRGDISISFDTLKNRIQDRARSLDCEVPEETEETSDAADLDGLDYQPAPHADCGCGCGGGGDCDSDNTDTNTMDFDIDDLSPEAALAKIEAEHDGVAERLDDLREAQGDASAARDAAEELGLDDTTDLADAVSVREERIDTLEEKLDEARRPQMEDDAEFIAEHTDRFGEDGEDVIDSIEDDLDDGEDLVEAVADTRELVEDLTESYDEQTANSGSGDGDGTTDSTPSGGKYAKTPWE